MPKASTPSANGPASLNPRDHAHRPHITRDPNPMPLQQHYATGHVSAFSNLRVYNCSSQLTQLKQSLSLQCLPKQGLPFLVSAVVLEVAPVTATRTAPPQLLLLGLMLFVATLNDASLVSVLPSTALQIAVMPSSLIEPRQLAHNRDLRCKQLCVSRF